MDNMKLILTGLAAAGAALTLYSAARPAPARPEPKPGPAGPQKAERSGTLLALDRDGRPAIACPLRHTDITADISGFLARVNVTQEFENTTGGKIEAVYTFPLPEKAAVDDMTMLVGDRRSRGKIEPKEKARQIFDEARRQGHTASLLDQERPNIFTQSVTNIGPGMKVKITISYVETLKYEGGSYSFAFPMVVGPRYIPGEPIGKTGGGWSPDTGHVPDASKITPPVAVPGTRAGHDISLRVNLDAGVPVTGLSAETHAVDIERPNGHTARVSLKNANEIPNRDFVLTYGVAGGRIEDAVLAHRAERGGFFTLILQPPDRPAANEITPKEIVFVVDTSGSMHGYPLEKCKELIKLSLDGLHPRDTFNLITFSGDTELLFPKPVAATRENVQRAQRFMLSRDGRGGTEMMTAIRAALEPSGEQDHVRIVVFLTDGYVGNDMEIVGEVKRHSNARVFSFGIGSSVNRFLLDKMAEEGRGEVEYVNLHEDGSAAAKRLYERVRTPMLTDIEIDWNGLPVRDTHPKRARDLFAARPLIVHGRYDGAAHGTIRLKGNRAGRPFVREIPVDLPASEANNDVLASLWARTRVEELMAGDWNGMQRGQPSGDLKDRIVKLGIEFRLMTQFTSFVAVEETTVVKGGELTRVEVPVELPHGVSYEGVFGDRAKSRDMAQMAPMTAAPTGSFGRGNMSGVIGGIIGERMSTAPTAPPPPRREAVSAVERDASSKLDGSLAGLSQSGSQTVVQVKIWLTEESAAVIDKLKKLGFEISARMPGKLLIGKVKAYALAKIAEIKEVLFVGRDLGKP